MRATACLAIYLGQHSAQVAAFAEIVRMCPMSAHGQIVVPKRETGRCRNGLLADGKMGWTTHPSFSVTLGNPFLNGADAPHLEQEPLSKLRGHGTNQK